MCGILFTNDSEIPRSSFLDALYLMKHRGPDAPGGYAVYNTLQLGHNRLKIMDLDDRSNQPLCSREKHHVIVFNGEIYNFRELAEQFAIRQKTASDTELLLELFLKLGPEMLCHLNGMFAFVIVDVTTGSFFAARDRLGVKPLYWSREGDRYIFSSEILPVVRLRKTAEPDCMGLRQYRKLRAFFNGRTIYEGISMFPAGHYMEDGRIRRYWSLPVGEQSPPDDDELLDLVESAVRFRTLSDVSVGSYLSGGLDSTIIAGLSGESHTWTVGMPGNDEFPWGRVAARRFGTLHHEVVVSPEEFQQAHVHMVKLRGEPLSVPNEVLLYKMTCKAKQYNTVILSGEGADELFFGYDRIFRWAAGTKRFDIVSFSRHYAYGSEDDPEIVEDAVAPFYHHGSPLAVVAAFMQIAHLHGLLRRLDNASMLCGVEARTPFVDYRIVERLAGTPYSYRMQDGVVKAPLKRIFRDLVPVEIINRTKVGFPVDLTRLVPGDLPGNTLMDKWFSLNLLYLGFDGR